MLWIVVIFTVIAITLVAIFMLVYHSVLQKERYYTMRNQADVLADVADTQIVGTLQDQVLQRLAGKDLLTGYISAFAQEETLRAVDIRNLSEYFVDINAAFPQTDRLEIYFPSHRMVVGSLGVRFLEDKKHLNHETEYDYLSELPETDFCWLRHLIHRDGTETAYITLVRAYPGVFPSDCQPRLILSVSEENFHAMLRASLRTLAPEDMILLVQSEGVIWSAEDASLIGTTLSSPDSSFRSCTLANGQSVVFVEAVSASGSWRYVLAHPSAGRFTGYDSIFSIWALVCLALLIIGLILVLQVMMKHYALPMRRLIRHFSIPEEEEDGKRLSVPEDHFLQIETALSDMSKINQEQEAFLAQNRPLLRDAWLNCFIRGEANYLGAQPQLGIDFPHPFFQVVIASSPVTSEEKECILSAFEPAQWTVAAFESREKESVFLFNHGFDEHALAQKLEALSPRLDALDSSLVLGVGILAVREELTAASFRCARHALSARYFEKNQRVSVFDPHAPHAEAESALIQIISQLTELTSLIRHQSEEEVNQAIDSIILQIKESNPYPNVMRSIMLLAAMFLTKVVYDMRGDPAQVYADNLCDAYYHIEGISEFAQRLKQDSARLSRFLCAESSAGNRSVVQYAIYHIRNSPPAELSTQSIADALSISTGHLSRVFHQETGRKLVDYLQEVRMEHAARLLAEGKLSNSEICEAIGYSRLQYFSAKFKEHYGFTLNEYRRKCCYEQSGASETDA